MIIDPFGDILSECRKLNDKFVSETLTKEKLSQAGDHRYLQAQVPLLYKHIIECGT